MALLDSDILIAFLRGREEAAAALRRVSKGRVSTISAFELYRGAWRARTPKAAVFTVGKLLHRFHLVPFDEECALQAGRIDAALHERGEEIGIQDVMIAATAIARGEALISRNEEHFRRVPGLKLVGW